MFHYYSGKNVQVRCIILFLLMAKFVWFDVLTLISLDYVYLY